MKLVTQKLRKKLIANWGQDGDTPPVMKIFNPTGAATWMVHSMNPEDEDTLYGLCDLGMGCPELGYISLQKLQNSKARIRIIAGGRNLSNTVGMERDRYFKTSHSLREYAQAAQDSGSIIKAEQKLERTRREELPPQAARTETR